ncbi:MAG TPA: hypothetical protein VH917_04250 [Ignavibacteriaceae bacterium]
MQRLLNVFSVLFVILFLNGCLKVETTVNVNTDGSGTIEETVFISREFADMIEEFSQSFGDTTEKEEFTLFKEDELISAAENYGEGVNYVSGEKISNDKWEGFKAVYSFSDLNTIRMKPDPDSKVSVGVEEDSLDEQKDYYYFKFTGGNVASVIIDRPDIKPDLNDEEEHVEEEYENESEEMDAEFVKMMEGMSVKIDVNFNGKILETNASYVEGSKITLIGLELDAMLKDKENLKLFKQKQPQTIEELKEFVEKVPGMKLELQRPVTVNFK